MAVVNAILYLKGSEQWDEASTSPLNPLMTELEPYVNNLLQKA